MDAQSSKLRSRAWFDNPANIDITALYLERYLDFGLSLEELRSVRPIIGLAQTGSDLSPCNRHHLVLAERVRGGRDRPGSPGSSIQETGKRPITPETLLFMRGAGPIGYPGAAEVVNMRPPAYLITEGIHALPCIGDGRQSGTSGSPSILNASPEAAAMGGSR